MSAITVSTLSWRDLEDVVARFEHWRFGPAVWVPDGESAAVPHLVREILERALDRGRGWVARGPSGVEGVATCEPLEWDTAFFGVACSQMRLFQAEAGTAEALARRVSDELRGTGHVRAEIGATQHAELASLQDQGWRVLASGLLSVVDLGQVDAANLAWPEGYSQTLALVPYDSAYLEPLLDAARRLPPTSWLQRDPTLSKAAREAYTVELTRNCLSTDFADVRMVLLDGQRPVGMNASKIFRFPAAVGGRAYTWERFALIDPGASKQGYMGLLARRYLAEMKSRVRYTVGRMLLENAPMMRMVVGANARPAGGHHLLVLR